MDRVTGRGGCCVYKQRSCHRRRGGAAACLPACRQAETQVRELTLALKVKLLDWPQVTVSFNFKFKFETFNLVGLAAGYSFIKFTFGFKTSNLKFEFKFGWTGRR